jgi:hypothetical protein
MQNPVELIRTKKKKKFCSFSLFAMQSPVELILNPKNMFYCSFSLFALSQPGVYGSMGFRN